MKFYDMDGVEIKVGDYVEPVEGRKVKIISCGNAPGYSDGEVLIGQQVENLFAFSVLTAENLAFQFRKTDDKNVESEIADVLDILTGNM